MHDLERILAYRFKNKDLLTQALTRQSAIEEKILGAAKTNYQSLKYMGEVTLKHFLARSVFIRAQNKFSKDDIDREVTKLMDSESTLVEIAKNISLSIFIIKSENETGTDIMYAEALEAIIGAISVDIDSARAVSAVILKLWNPYLKKLFPANEISVEKQSTLESNNNNLISPDLTKDGKAEITNQTRPLSPNSQKMFFNINGPVNRFQRFAAVASSINVQNPENGDTVLMSLLRKKPLKEKDISKIKIVLARNVSWSIKNNQGKTAEDLLKQHPQEIVAKFKK